LLKKDLYRDATHPWGLIVFMIIPIVIAIIISLVFSPKGDAQENIVIDLAVLDRDDDFLSGALRSLSRQGDAAQNLRLHFVENEDEGIRLLEKRKVSALVVLPEHLTTDLLDGIATSLTLYKNPAQTILPLVVDEGLKIICIGVSEALRLLQPEMKAIREMMDQDHMPNALDVGRVASGSVERLRTVEPYLFPPLIQFESIKASEYVPSMDPNQAPVQDPNQ
jgi:hypothetical protein